MKFYAYIILTCFLFIFSTCSEEGNNPANTTATPPPDIYWVSSGLDSNFVYSLFETSVGRILAGTNYGLFISADSGTTWQEIAGSISTSAVSAFCNYHNSILAGTSGSGVFISIDNGNTWTNIGPQGISITAVAVSNTGRIFAASRGNGIFYSDSINSTWKPANPDFNAHTFSSLLSKGNTIFAGGTGVYRSDDNGSKWNLKNKGLGNWSVQSLITDLSGNVCAGTDNGGFFRTTDNAENWTKQNIGLANTEITCLAENSAGHIFAGTWRGGVFRTAGNVNSWTAVDSGLTMTEVSSLLVTNDDILFAGTFKGVFRTLYATSQQAGNFSFTYIY